MTVNFGAGIWHFASYVDRYATDGYAEPIGMLEMIDRAGEVGDLSVVDLNYSFPGCDAPMSEVKALRRVERGLERLDFAAMQAAQDAQDAVEATRLASDALFGDLAG
jgi:hypothetical protein